MGNCCVKKPTKKVGTESQNHDIHIKKSYSIELNKQDGPKATPEKNQVPKLPAKKRVQETIKLVQSIDADGNKLLNEYMLLEVLGRGSFGKVKKVEKKNAVTGQKKYFAIKIFKKTQLKRKREFFVDKNGKRQVKSALDDVRREIAIMKKLNHENVMKLYEVIEAQEGEKLYMVIDYADGGQIIDWDDDEQKWIFIQIERESTFNEDNLKQILRDSIDGLHYLHQHNIVHRDIKPQNLLFNAKGRVLLADFGVSSIVQDDDTLTNTEGTYFFMAPEVLDKENINKGYSGRAADIWSLGITMFCFAFRIQPYLAENQFQFMEKLQNEELVFPSTPKYSSGFIDLLKQMLVKNPEQRINIEQIAQNKWINDGYSKKLSDQMKINQLEQVNDEDIRMALQLSTVVRIKKWVQNWKSSRKLSQTSKMSMSGQIQETNMKESNQNASYQGQSFLNPNQVNITASNGPAYNSNTCNNNKDDCQISKFETKTVNEDDDNNNNDHIETVDQQN